MWSLHHPPPFRFPRLNISPRIWICSTVSRRRFSFGIATEAIPGWQARSRWRTPEDQQTCRVHGADDIRRPPRHVTRTGYPMYTGSLTEQYGSSGTPVSGEGRLSGGAGQTRSSRKPILVEWYCVE